MDQPRTSPMRKRIVPGDCGREGLARQYLADLGGGREEPRNVWPEPSKKGCKNLALCAKVWAGCRLQKREGRGIKKEQECFYYEKRDKLDIRMICAPGLSAQKFNEKRVPKIGGKKIRAIHWRLLPVAWRRRGRTERGKVN